MLYMQKLDDGAGARGGATVGVSCKGAVLHMVPDHEKPGYNANRRPPRASTGTTLVSGMR